MAKRILPVSGALLVLAGIWVFVKQMIVLLNLQGTGEIPAWISVVLAVLGLTLSLLDGYFCIRFWNDASWMDVCWKLSAGLLALRLVELIFDAVSLLQVRFGFGVLEVTAYFLLPGMVFAASRLVRYGEKA